MEAAKMFAQGASRAEVARGLRVSWQTSHTWFKAWHSGGQAALKSKGEVVPLNGARGQTRWERVVWVIEPREP